MKWRFPFILTKFKLVRCTIVVPITLIEPKLQWEEIKVCHLYQALLRSKTNIKKNKAFGVRYKYKQITCSHRSTLTGLPSLRTQLRRRVLTPCPQVAFSLNWHVLHSTGIESPHGISKLWPCEQNTTNLWLSALVEKDTVHIILKLFQVASKSIMQFFHRKISK